MICVNGRKVEIGHFPDGTLLMKEDTRKIADIDTELVIRWNYENNEELLALYFLTRHIRAAGITNIVLDMPYIPNARQDRVKNPEDVFTLKYFAELINSLEYKEVRVLDAHSNVSLALLDRVKLISPEAYINKAIETIAKERGREPLMFYPDEGAGKRYGGMIAKPYCFGIKKRDWSTGQIKELTVTGETEMIHGSDVLIVDDICSFGGTFLASALKLKELGAVDIYLYVSHLESAVLKGELIQCKHIKKIYTTDSIWNDECIENIKGMDECLSDKIEIIEKIDNG